MVIAKDLGHEVRCQMQKANLYHFQTLAFNLRHWVSLMLCVCKRLLKVLTKGLRH